ncbi:MAG TPA: pyridoxamine 5'-phosphate oxidase family protein [Solirubrobacteraceae bacterium]|nr:pyridoxamine 5'-phosphate oxidase family protein [Solirubrobacteraceae bacterium]
MSLYHEGSRELQDRFDSRRIADRLEEVNVSSTFSDAQREIIDAAAMFWLATADADGFPDVSYKGGMPGFVRVVGPSELAFPNYDGNGMYKSLGNVLVNPRVGLLFIRWSGGQRRVRVQGRASLHHDDPLMAEWEGAELVVRVRAERIFSNCPRYLHHMELREYSAYAPRAGHTPPVPDWKRRPEYRDHLPARDRAAPAGDDPPGGDRA